MAKSNKPSLKGILEKTTPASSEKKPGDIIAARGVGLKKSEWAQLEKISKELGTSLHSVTAYGVRYFLKAYQAGKIQPETRKTQKLPDL